MTAREYGLILLALGILPLLPLRSAQGQTNSLPGGAAWDWCGTQRIFEQKYKARYGTATAPEACDFFSACDDPEERDTWVPAGGENTQYVRMIIHVLALDDGSSPFSTPEHVAGQVAQLNADFAQAGIQFVYQLHQVNSTAWRNLSESEITDMKMATSIEPDKYLNVWVTVVDFSYSFGTFPWSYDALQPTGGIVMGHFHWVDLPNRVFAHEVGHTLGLWHTFHGVDEVDRCGQCYESPGSHSSVVGDLCADTPPTPTNQGPCVDYPGADSCSGQPWGYTMPENYMGYASQVCLNTFTPQQRGRLRCWSNTALDHWVIPFQMEPSATLGPAPLAVEFVTNTHKPATGWTWDFGDGGSSSEPSPSHAYTEPGLRSVTVDMQTATGDYSREFPGLIAVYADTLVFGDSHLEDNIAVVEVYTRNCLPVKKIVVPFVYDGPFELRFDSVSANGLRSGHMQAHPISLVENWNSATVLLDAESGPPLQPGAGPVARLYFTREQPGGFGSVPIQVTSYSSYHLTFACDAGNYEPVSYAGSITSSCCRGIVGDANGDGGFEPTISDVSVMVAHLFINGLPLDCYPEADANQSGGPDATAKDITISDVSVLVDHLFISGVPLAECL